MSKILGFDISSSTVGWCILEINDLNVSFIKAEYLKPTKKGTIIERLVDTRDKIKKIIEQEQPDYIGVEDIIQFMSGASTAKTIIILTSFNRMISLLSQDYLQEKNKTSIELFSVMTMRHGLKIGKILPKKEDMPLLVATHLGIIFPWEKGKKGAIKSENYDKADAAVVALYYAFLLTGKIKRKDKKNETTGSI
jgi:Holliday junction resolvasome RuvABC endonuclease subunit